VSNASKIILDLCGGTGSWSNPYKEAGYDVRLITLPDFDVREYEPPSNVYGILAAPPCTHFTNSGAQYWKQKDQDGRTLTDTQIITHCLRIIAMSSPKFWAIENPTGRFGRWMGKPQLTFNPCDLVIHIQSAHVYGGDSTLQRNIQLNLNSFMRRMVIAIQRFT
jgi:hypothetical protein